MGHLVGHPSERLIWAAFTFINSFITIAILAGVAMVSRTPFVFPSLGPTAFLSFFSPRSPAATPRHAVFGHLIGILCGYGSLWLFETEMADQRRDARRERHVGDPRPQGRAGHGPAGSIDGPAAEQ